MRKLPILSLLLVGWVIALAAITQPSLAAPTAATPISPVNASIDHPTLAITRQGSIHIAWAQDDGIWYRQWRNGQWSAIQQLAASGKNPTLAVDPFGEVVYLAWEQLFDGNYEIFTRRWDPIQGWSPSHNASDNDGGSTSPTFAVSPEGVIHLIWADTTPGTSTLYHAISTDGLAWPTALPIDQTKGSHPTAAFDAQGTLHVAWQYRTDFTDNLRIWTASYTGQSWSQPQALTDGTTHAFAPEMAGQAGRVALAWQEGNQARLALLDQNRWQVVQTQPGESPDVAITAQGITEWAWRTDQGLARQFGISQWTHPQTWAAPDGRQVALTAQGSQVGMVWIQGPDTARQVFYNQDILATMYQPIIQKAH